MAKLKKNIFAKVCLVIAFSLIFTVTFFAGGFAIAFSQAGLYNSSLHDFQAALLSDKTYGAGAEIQHIVEVTKKGKLKINDFEDEVYDYIVEYEGKKVYSSFDKNEEYIAHTKQDVWIDYDEKSGEQKYLQVDTYLKDGANAEIIKLQKQIGWIYTNKNALIIAACIGLVISILLFVIMMMGAGRREEDDEIHIRKIDKLPPDIYFILAGSAICGIIAIGVEIMANDLYTGTIACFFMGILCMFIFSAFMMSAAVNAKCGRLLKTTVIGRVILVIVRGIRAIAKAFIEKIPVIWKCVAGAVILAVINLFVIACTSYSGPAPAWAVFTGLVFIAAVTYLAIGFARLKEGGDNVAAGNTEYRIETAHMLPSMKQHGENINSINEAVTRAVDEQMKSERFKTELITNVSHDIKTPLTSIINYTDLLMAEDIDNETAREYIGIISKHAARLKKLTVDVVDASKASTGNVKIELVKISIGMMAEQVFGEYREKIEEKGLSPILSICEENIEVMADGNHMGRVLDNVLSNICKYAQEGTRVYMDVFRKNDRAFVVFKNISSQELNISPDELMERFVRGDESRNSEGSGLGLNIASSLMRLQGGDFNISIDGDLFKTEISMPIA